ncbi:MAG: hypothetical protein AAFV19_05305 [Pseudomonadota bacterium]
MSLGQDTTKAHYIRLMRQLWVKWNEGPIPEKYRVLRVERIARTIAPKIPTPDIHTAVIGRAVRGQFESSTWSLVLNNLFFEEQEYTYRRFLILATTVYHEMRHAEQWWRCLQALHHGFALLPDYHFQIKPTDDRAYERMSVKTKAAIYERGLPDRQKQQRHITASLLANRLNVPMYVARAATNSAKADLQNFLDIHKEWYVRRDAVRELQKWVNYLIPGPKYSDFNQNALRTKIWSPTNPGPFDAGVLALNRQKMYQDNPIEKDAHHLPDDIAFRLATSIGVRADDTTRSKKRDDPVFNHLN